jgi:hypothetical protein
MDPFSGDPICQVEASGFSLFSLVIVSIAESKQVSVAAYRKNKDEIQGSFTPFRMTISKEMTPSKEMTTSKEENWVHRLEFALAAFQRTRMR